MVVVGEMSSRQLSLLCWEVEDGVGIPSRSSYPFFVYSRNVWRDADRSPVRVIVVISSGDIQDFAGKEVDPVSGVVHVLEPAPAELYKASKR